MATPRFAWGIDVGNRALKAVRLSHDPETGVKIDDVEVIEHEQVLSNSGDNRETLVQGAINAFAQHHDLRGAPVAIGVSGQSSFARFIKLPPVESKKIPEIVRFEAIQQIPFPLDDVEWSYQLFQDENSPDVEVGIFAMRKELVNQHIKYFTDAGLNVQVVQMNPLAVYNAMYYDKRIKGSTMIVDLGAENTDLIIAEGETIWLRSIPIGGNNFTEALVKSFKLKFQKAEELKRNAATSKYGRQILQAMRPVFNDLVSEIQRSIGFYASVHRESRISRVLALGGTFRLPGLQKYVQQNLQLDVHRIDRVSAAPPPDARVATAFNENILSSASAYGLALQALGDAKINSSLLPMKIRREKLWQEKTKWFGAAAALFVLGAGAYFGGIALQNHNLQSASPEERQVDTALAQAKSRDAAWDQIEGSGAPERQRIANVQSMLQYRDVQPMLVADILSSLPAPPAGMLTADMKKKFPDRSKRPIIRINSVSEIYYDDISKYLTMSQPDFEHEPFKGNGIAPAPGADRAMGDAGAFYQRSRRGMAVPVPSQTPTDPSATTGPKQRGFVVLVTVTTPNADGPSFVSQTLVNALQKHKDNGNGQSIYSIERVAAPDWRRVKDDPAKGGGETGGARGMRQFNPRSGRMRGGFGGQTFSPDFGAGLNAGPTSEPAEVDPFLDPATGEDTKNDWEVTVRMVVLLDPQPKSATPAAAQANANQ